MDSCKKGAVEKLILLLSRDDIDMDTLSNRAKKNDVSPEERYFLGLVLGYLNKIFGAQTTFMHEKASLDMGKKLKKKQRSTKRISVLML